LVAPSDEKRADLSETRRAPRRTTARTLATIGPMKGVLGLLAAAVVALASVWPAPARSSATALQHVTVIGDSVASAIRGDSAAITTLGQGVHLDLELAGCRRVGGLSCPVNGVSPPNVVELTKAMGSKLGPNVVVAVGYNDFEGQYAQSIETALAAFQDAGVQHVWWLTLREAHHPYVHMNDDIRAAAQKHPELSVIGWNLYSRSHRAWFQQDGLHLVAAGAEAMARLIHKTLLHDGVAPWPVRVATTALPIAWRGQPYTAKLAAVPGLEPYRWSLLEKAPAGLHLEGSGAVIGTPRAKPGLYALNVQVKDAVGSVATRRLFLRIKL
jgi:hypothetical protein